MKTPQTKAWLIGILPLCLLSFTISPTVGAEMVLPPARGASKPRIEEAEVIVRGKFVQDTNPVKFRVADILKGNLEGEEKVLRMVLPTEGVALLRIAAGAEGKDYFLHGWPSGEDTIVMNGIGVSVWPSPIIVEGGEVIYLGLIDGDDPDAYAIFVERQLNYSELAGENMAQLAVRLVTDIEDPERLPAVLAFLEWEIMKGTRENPGSNQHLRRQLLTLSLVKLSEQKNINYEAVHRLLADSQVLPFVPLIDYCLLIADQTESKSTTYPFDRIRTRAITAIRPKLRVGSFLSNSPEFSGEIETDFLILRSYLENNALTLRLRDTQEFLNLFDSQIPEMRAARDKIMNAIWEDDAVYQSDGEISARSQLVSVEDHKQYWNRFYRDRAMPLQIQR